MAAEPIDTLATEYQPAISETIDSSGFKHPGVGFTKEMLENVRTQVRAKKEPWNTYFNKMLLAPSASRTPTIRNVNGTDPSKPRILGIDSQGANGSFIGDSITAYTQAILYYVTGDEVYRANAMRIIRLYEQMDPTKYVYFVDSHIHTGIPLSRMVSAAEILRYTSTQNPALAWTEDDTLNFSTNLVVPVVQTFNNCNCRFMNQHLYTTIAKMSGSIFLGDREGYDQAVEWFTVNKDAPDLAWTGSIKQLFRVVTRNDLTGEEVPPNIQHMEMGRDQAHGAGDLTNAQLLSRFMMAQGTKVDPVVGTPSTEANAVGPYEFLNDRILAVHELFGRFMIGHEIPWVPAAMSYNPDGSVRAIYPEVSWAYRGRTLQNTWEAFYYYQYARGINMEQQAPGFTKFFAQRAFFNWEGVDGGGDFWLAIPKEAEAEGGKYLAKTFVEPYREAEDRFTAFDENSIAKTEGTTSYVEVTAKPEGTRLALFGNGTGTPSFGLRIRTNGTALLEVYGTSYNLPDTQGQWRYVIIQGNVDDYIPLKLTGSGTTVDIDHIHVKASTLTPPAFKLGSGDLTLHTYAGVTIPTTIDLSATDANAADVLSYKLSPLPPGASFNTSTGAFSWKPTQAGTYNLVAEASDGTTISTKRVNIIVGADRQATVATVTAPFSSDKVYVTSTLAAYNSVHADMMNTIGSSTDEAYFQKLAALKNAVAGLRELNPLLKDGSLDYTYMFHTSHFGNDVRYALDFNPGSFVGFSLAQESNRAFTLDFGPGFKVSATAFGLQPRTSFPERIGGVAIFASNDNENWTRLTPGETIATEDMQTLEVQEDLRNQRYRFIKIHMFHPINPNYNILEPGEFRIFGTRHETINKLASVSLGSDQAIKNRITSGDTIKLGFQAVEPINNVNLLIQGQPAVATSADNLNWMATLPVNASTTPGPVKFLLNYQTAQGVAAEPVLFTTDTSSLYIADSKDYIGNMLDVTTVTDSSNRNATDALTVARNLFDKNMASATDYRVNGSGYGGWVSFDFRPGGTAKLSRVDILARQDQVARINGAVVQGSNDYANWTTISNAARNSADWQSLIVNDETPYRYIRIFNANQWFGNMSELRFYGVVASTNKLASVSIGSPEALRTRIVPGNKVNLSFKAKEAISNVSATIQGETATLATSDNINFTATATLPQGAEAGTVKFAINYTTQDGQAGYPGTTTTDGTTLSLVDEADTIKNVAGIATLIDSSYNRSASMTLAAVNNLFDGNLASSSDFRIGTNNSGTGSYITFDFKSGNQVNLTSVELAARQDQYFARIKNTVIQGSNDNTNWTTLTPAAASTLEWQTLAVSSMVPYRYIRIYNATAWFGNMAEVRLHGSVHGADTTAPSTTATAPQGTANTDTTVTFNATDNQGGSGVAATHFTVNGGAKQSGTSVSLTASGSYTVSYWSVDWAGNSEEPHTVTVNIDKSVDVTGQVAISRSGLSVNRFTSKYTGTVTITNTGGQAVTGPLQLRLEALSAGVTLDNKTGEKDGVPYMTLPAADLAPGQSVTLTTTFSNPSKVSIGYTPKLISIR